MGDVQVLIDDMKNKREVCWVNPGYLPFEKASAGCRYTLADVLDADSRLRRFAPYISSAFPETAGAGGIIESELREIPFMKNALAATDGIVSTGRFFLKTDSHLPVAGSVKARGGVYEILKLSEDIALRHGLIAENDDYSVFNSEKFRKVFSSYRVAVGSTGNLGLSIGIISARLGFSVSVHMSADAKQWKKDKLRENGVNVIEYDSDYSEAVRQGRLLAERDPMCHFVDDENSETLFFGYSAAALRLKNQLEDMNIPVDSEHPLMVYLPCGVGGAPGGIAFGLKQVFGDNVHCFFAEPVGAPCMTLGLCTGKHNEISVSDIGLDGKTEADGLAVGRASGFVGRLIETFIAGSFTVTDEKMTDYLKLLYKTESIFLEPSALAGIDGIILAEKNEYIKNLIKDKHSTHIAWATGGGMVPDNERKRYISD